MVDVDLGALCVGAADPLRVAFDRMQAGGLGLVVVVDADGRVVGPVSDAALRRAALAENGLDTAVAGAIGRRSPLVRSDQPDDEVAALLRAARLRSAPVVDADARLVGVRTLDELPGGDGRPPPEAVVMVGGRGERLRPLTDRVPKPLLRIGGRPIVERIVASLRRAGIRKVHLAVNYMAAEFEEQLGDGSRLDVELSYLHEEEVLGTAGALSLLAVPPPGPVLVTNGDLVTGVDHRALLDFHWHHGGAITVAGVEHLTPVPYGVLRSVEHHLLHIDEKPSRRDRINAGMYVLEPEVLALLPEGEVGMPDLIATVVAEGLPVHVFPVLERWIDIGSPEELERVMVLFATGEEE